MRIMKKLIGAKEVQNNLDIIDSYFLYNYFAFFYYFFYSFFYYF